MATNQQNQSIDPNQTTNPNNPEWMHQMPPDTNTGANTGAPVPTRDTWSPWTNAPNPTNPAYGAGSQNPSYGGIQYGGQDTVGAQANPYQYDELSQFSDQAYDYSRRYIDPQQEQQNNRYDQELINRGVDPRSEMGREMAMQLARQQNDQNNASAYSAMEFGKGIQDQMFNQSFMNTQQAGDMQKARWMNDTNRYGTDVGRDIARMNNDTSRYGTDKSYALGQDQLGLSRQQQDFNEFLGYDAIDYRNQNFNEQNDRWDQGLMMQFFGMDNPFGVGVAGNAPTGGYDDFANAYEDFMKNRG